MNGTHPLPRTFADWFARFLRAAAAAHREGFVRADLVEARLLADIGASPPPPTSEELRDAYRLWFGGDVMRRL